MINGKEKRWIKPNFGQKLAKQQASDSRDLVRCETGNTVVETGEQVQVVMQFGVDENRVMVDATIKLKPYSRI